MTYHLRCSQTVDLDLIIIIFNISLNHSFNACSYLSNCYGNNYEEE